MPVKREEAEVKPKTTRKPPAWKQKAHDIVNSGSVGKQQYKVGEKITPENKGQEERLRKYMIIK